MGFWDAAMPAFDAGLQMGTRANERKADLQLRKQERETDRTERDTVRREGLDERKAVRATETTRYEADKAENTRRYTESQIRLDDQQDREATKFDQEQKDREKKEQFEKTRKKFDAAALLFDSGADRQAAAILIDAYNNDLINGDEIRVIFKSDAANPELKAKWDTDPNFQGKDIVVQSKQNGILPFKNMRDVMKYAAAKLDQKTFLEGSKQAEQSIAALNAKEQPFLAKDGHKYLQTWELGPGGLPKKGPITPYTGVDRASALQEKVADTETVLGRKPTTAEKQTILGVREKEKTAAPAAAEDTMKALKSTADLTGKQRDQFKKDLDLVLRPFSAGGKPVLDFKTGEITTAGTNALATASKLVDKAAASPATLSVEEKRNLPHAKRALQIYEAISGFVSKGYGATPGGEKPQAGSADMPDPVANKGRRMTDTDTGKKYKSDGTKWIEVKNAGTTKGF